MPIATRRSFLRASFGALAAAPILRPSYAFAATVPTRLVIFTLPNGVRQEDWFSGDINDLGEFLAPLAPFRDRINVMRGLTNKAALLSDAPDHQPDFSSLLTGRPPTFVGSNNWDPKTPSIDQTIAAWTMGQMERPQLASLHFGARSGKVAFFGEGGSNVRAENNPYSMFDRHFAALGLDQAELANIRASRKSVLDMVSSAYQSERCSYGTPEQRVLDAHLQRIRSLEMQLQDLGTAACQPPTIAQGVDPSSDQQMIAVGELQQQMLALSLACGITRVATMQHAGGQTAAHSEGNTDEWHAVSHDNAATEQQRREVDHAHMRWPAKQFAKLLVALDSIPEGDGTVLDHTMVLWVHEQGRTPTHDRHDHCVVVAGGANGQLKGGQSIDFGGRKYGGTQEGEPMNKVLVSAAQIMGMSIDRFGDERIPSGPLSSIMR